MKDKFVAHYAANNETESFLTFEDAEKWLQNQYDEDSSEGFSQESCGGDDYIAKISHRSCFIETDKKSDYPWDESAQANINSDGEEWCSEHDFIGKIVLQEVEEKQP
jgi:hypothetical protein